MNEPLLTAADLQTYIDSRGIAARLIDDVGHTPTVPAAAAALGVEPDQIVKTLLFLLDLRRSAEDEPQPLVVISNGESRVDKKLLAQRFSVGAKRVKLAPPETVLRLLGYAAGGVPPFGHRSDIPVIVDASLLPLRRQYGGRIYAGGGDDHTMMELTVDELLRVVRPEIVAVSEAEQTP
jgi:prolyl-tRNA editing enzyme YbaK/EbsC (Cys-tRNA(Pro) deacylase)